MSSHLRSTISTSNLKLVPIADEHIPGVHDVLKHPEVDRFNTFGVPANPGETGEKIKHLLEAWLESDIRTFTWVVVHSDEIVGLCGLFLDRPKYSSGDIYYKLKPDHWGKGWATEIAKAILEFGFSNLELHRITAGCAVENVASYKIMEKLGMRREGRLKSNLPLKTGWEDSYMYAILDTEFDRLIE